MPTYQYTCTDCGEQVEAVQKFSDDPLTVCPACSGKLRKVFSPVGIVFKGSGFYRTDSRNGSSSDGPGKKDKDKESSGAKSSDSSSGSSKDSGSGSGSGSRSRRPRALDLGLIRPAPDPDRLVRRPPARGPRRVPATKRAARAGHRPVVRARSLPVRVSQPADDMSHPAEVGSAGASLPNLARAEIGVIGGSGFYEFLESADEISVDTPFGPPSDPVVTGEVAGRRVAFLPRHGHDRRFPPHRIPYQANLWALRSLGVRQMLAPSAVGALDLAHKPGRLAIPNQLVDRTRPGAAYYDDGRAVHVPFADPYCPAGRAQAIGDARAATGSRPSRGRWW